MSKNPERFGHDAQYYVCPVCRRPLRLKKESLRCEGGHCFEIGKDGFVNLRGKARAVPDQNPDARHDRLFIMEQGVYQPIVDEIVTAASAPQSTVPSPTLNSSGAIFANASRSSGLSAQS